MQILAPVKMFTDSAQPNRQQNQQTNQNNAARSKRTRPAPRVLADNMPHKGDRTRGNQARRKPAVKSQRAPSLPQSSEDSQGSSEDGQSGTDGSEERKIDVDSGAEAVQDGQVRVEFVVERQGGNRCLVAVVGGSRVVMEGDAAVAQRNIERLHAAIAALATG